LTGSKSSCNTLFENQLGSSMTQTVQIRRSTGRFTQSLSSADGRVRRTYSGSCARLDTAVHPSGSSDLPGKEPQVGANRRIPQSPHGKIDEVIASGRYTRLPPAHAVAHSTDSGTSHLSVLNRTVYTLTVTFYGATERSAKVSAGKTLELDFVPGTYRVLGSVNSPTVLPFVGGDEYVAGTKYESTFYVASQKFP